MIDISADKQAVLDRLESGSVNLIQGEAGTGKTLLGILCGGKLLKAKKPWQKVLYLTYSKLARWQINHTHMKLEKEGMIDQSQSERMHIENFHSLWWDLICQNHAFLGISKEPRICLQDELKQMAEDCLNSLSSEERRRIIPSYFLRSDGHFDERVGHFDLLSRCMQGEALIYADWGEEHFGKRADRFNGESKFLSWAKDIVEKRNRQGLFSHAETVCWVHKLISKHPHTTYLIKTTHPIDQRQSFLPSGDN